MKKRITKRKAQESLLNVVAVMIVASVLFLYFFFVTQGQRIESNALFSKEMKYRYAENILMNMYFVNTQGAYSETYAGIIGRSNSDEGTRDAAEHKVNIYLDLMLEDYDYYFLVQDEDEEIIFEVNERPDEDMVFSSHRIVMPDSEDGSNMYAYLYVW